MNRTRKQLIHEGRFAAEVDIEVVSDSEGWGDTIAPDQVRKLDQVRLALRRGDIAAAAKEAKVYELLPISA